MTKMSFEDFAEKVAMAVEAALAIKGKYVIATVEPLNKNGVSVMGIVIKKGEQNVAPCINCTSEQYEKVMSGELSFSKYLDDLVSIYQDAEREMAQYTDTEKYLNSEFVKANVFLSFVERERNKEWLKTVVHYPFADTNLELIARVRIKNGSFVVKRGMLDIIGISEDELLFNARINTVANATCIPMSKLFDMLGAPVGIPDDVPMYVITNLDMCLGAASILNEDYLKSMYETFATSLFILPSSVHECIVVPNVAGSDAPAEELLEMVRAVNQTSVEPQERLADSVYIYDGNTVKQLR